MVVPLRLRVLLGATAWLSALGAGAALLASPSVRGPLARTLGSARDDLLGAPERERVFAVEDVRGVEAGAPVFLASDEALAAPVGHVRRVEDGRLRVLLERGTPVGEDARLVCLPPSRTLAEALDLAVTPATAQRLGAALRERLGATFEEALLPGLEARLPAFVERLDPRHDTATQALVADVGASVVAHLAPHVDGLAAAVAAGVKRRFDLLDRLGLLWKVLRGDAQGLQREIAPIAKEVVADWWRQHDREVLGALGSALHDHEARLRAWVRGPLLDAAQDELLAPVVRAQRARLEAEAEALLGRAFGEVALAPGGGFRPRFASVLRTHLLGRGEALLLLVPGDAR